MTLIDQSHHIIVLVSTIPIVQLFSLAMSCVEKYLPGTLLERAKRAQLRQQTLAGVVYLETKLEFMS